ncbi:MAG: hypothetical protein KAT25_05250 [Sulfuriflexus sp.]|nr:hypothetical protein [Sulfuriflexus sp.]
MANRKHKYSTVATAAATFACGILLMPSANAMLESEMSVFGDAVELSDDEMGDMRGRYINGNQLSYFGVEMYTRWTNSNGETLTTGLVLGTEVALATTQIRPTVTVFQSSNATQNASNVHEGTISINSSGLDNVNGISQGIQVAGDLNEVRNELTFDIGPSNGTGRVHTEGTEIALNGPGNVIINDEAGNMTTFSLDSDGFGYTVSNSQQDQITQRVRNTAVDSVSGITQSVQIATNFNQVVNVTNIVAETRQLGANIQRPQLSTAFQSLRGLQTVGIF